MRRFRLISDRRSTASGEKSRVPFAALRHSIDLAPIWSNPHRVNSVQSSPGSPSPHEIETCRARLGDFALDCESGGLVGVDAVRQLNTLFAEMARNLSEICLHPIGAPLERMLAAGAAENGAMLLAGNVAGILVSRSPDGAAVASAWIPDRSEEQTVSAADCASALCGALARACVQALGSGPAPTSSAVN